MQIPQQFLWTNNRHARNFPKKNRQNSGPMNSKITFRDDILIFTTGSLPDNEKELDKTLNLLCEETPAINHKKCKCFKKHDKVTGVQNITGGENTNNKNIS